MVTMSPMKAMVLVVLVFLTSIRLDKALTIQEDRACGVSKGCYHDCQQQDGVCSFLITWRHVPEVGVVEFSMNKAVNNQYDTVWFAMGLSDDMYMGEDSVLECTTDRHTYTLAGVTQSYNERHYNVDILFGEYGLVGTVGRMADGLLQCNFTRHVIVPGGDRIYNLDRAWYLLVASGYTRDGVKHRHSLAADFPHVSPVTVDLRDHVDISGRAAFTLVQIHGCLMVLAWILLASTGIVVARVFKQPWCAGARAHTWHTVHKGLMVGVLACTLTAFVLIWLGMNGYSRLRGSSLVQKAHPVLGVIVMALTFLNPVIGVFHPSKSSYTRQMFRYVHGFVGTVTFILAVLNLIIGVTLPKAATPPHLMWLLTGFVVYQVLLHTALETLDLYLIRSGKLHDYEASRNTRNKPHHNVEKDPPGTFAKTIILAMHVLISVGVAVVSIVFIVT